MSEIYVVQADTLPPTVVDLLDTTKPSLSGMELVSEIIDPEIRKFEEWFQVPERGDGPLTRLERDLLRSYLYQKLMGVL